MFTSTDEFIPAFVEKPTTSKCTIKRQTPFGSSFVRPYVFDGATVYVQGSGKIIRVYLMMVNKRILVNRFLHLHHILLYTNTSSTLAGGIDRAESYYFLVDADGTLGVFSSIEVSRDMVGHSLQSRIIPFSSRYKVYAVVKFDRGGGTNKYILCEFDNTFNTDMAKTYSGSNGVFNVSADFTNGAVLDVVSGTHYLGQFTVASGISMYRLYTFLSAEIGFKFDVTSQQTQ